MRIRKVALIIFYDKQKRILLQYREPGLRKMGEEWGYFGGEIDEGETAEEAVTRETKEELDFDLKDYEFIGEFKDKVNEELIVDRFVFISPLKDNFSKFKQIEGKKMQLFSLEEAEKLKMVPGDEIVIKELKRIL